jgi:hypothetical protein
MYIIDINNCRLYSKKQLHKIKRLFDNLITNQTNSSIWLHVEQFLPKEDISLKNSILTSKKINPECENEKKFNFDYESQQKDWCVGVLEDFKDTYAIENLLPDTSYQFKIEVSNSYGQYYSLITEEIKGKYKVKI